MSIFDRRPGLRWAVPVAAGALVLAGAMVGTVGASADSGLPAKTAEQLLIDLQSREGTPLSGTVVATADLGLPALPMPAGSSSDLTALASGSHTIRVWSDGPARARAAIIGTADEADIIRNGKDVWMWSSSEATVEHSVVPERDASDVDLPALTLPSTPQQAAEMALQALDSTTSVSTSGVDQVAGRPVYELILTPRQDGTLVAKVVVALDSETGVPLRVQVFSTQMADPAFEVGFTSVDFSRPDASVFDFTPPPGATVTEHSAADRGRPGALGLGDAAARPTIVGTGWSQVAIAALPADAENANPLLDALPPTSGAGGSGRVLSGTLISAILTDDGRVAIGAVAPEALGAALAAQ